MSTIDKISLTQTMILKIHLIPGKLNVRLIAGPRKGADMPASAKVTQKVHYNYHDVFFFKNRMPKRHDLFTCQRRCKTTPGSTLTHAMHPAGTIQERIRAPAGTANNCTIRSG